MTDIGVRTGRILIPIDEQERREIDVAVVDSLAALFSASPDTPVRYDPPVHEPRRQPAPKYFHSGNFRSRIIYKRRVYHPFSKR